VADNDFIAPPPRNGGTGSPEVGNIRAPDYRQLQNPAQVRTDLPSSGAAERAAELGRVFKEFSSEASSVSDTLSSQAGSIAGAATGATGHPQYRTGLQRFSTYSIAFNNAATGAYAIQAKAQADDDAARLRIQANNDPAHFAATYSAVRDAVVKNAPPQAQAELTALYNERLAAGLQAISADQAAEIKQTQKATYDMGVQRQTSRVAILQGSDDPNDQLKALDEQVQLTQIIEGGVKAGLYSPAEAQAMHISSARAITEQVFSTQVDRELAKPGGDPMTLLERFRQAHIDNSQDTSTPQILSEPEFQKLMQDAKAKIQTQRLIEAYSKQQGKTAEQVKFDEGDQKYTEMFLRNQLTPKAIADAVRSGDIRPERATALNSALANGPAGAGNAALYFRLHNDPHVLDMAPTDVAAYVGPGGLNGKQADTLSQDIARRNGTWESTQQTKDAKNAIALALKIPAGTPSMALSDEQRKAQAEANQEFVTKMNALEPSQRAGSAMSVAQEVVKGVQQKEAAVEVQRLQGARANVLQNYGPSSEHPWSEEKMQTWLKQQDDRIKAASARAKAQ
jgi:hypothetical protein